MAWQEEHQDWASRSYPAPSGRDPMWW